MTQPIFSVLTGKSWGSYVCRKQSLSTPGVGTDVHFACITDCDTNPESCNSTTYPHHCNQSGTCADPDLPEQCDGYSSTTTYISECYNVNSCAECS
jgi:hypothetical protein